MDSYDGGVEARPGEVEERGRGPEGQAAHGHSWTVCLPMGL